MGVAGVEVIFGNSMGNLVQGNFIGTNAGGTAGLGNNSGMFVGFGASSNTVGGTVAAARNIISGNNGDGVTIDEGTGILVLGNFIGTQMDGSSPLGNMDDGVLILSNTGSNSIGGAVSGAGNTIAFSVGVHILSTTGNAIQRNSIFSNAGLGIDLQDNGVKPNDHCDPDAGANNQQNYPVLTSANSSGGSTTIQGTLDSTANTTFRVEFFSNAACDPSGNGEGQRLLGSAMVTTDGSCNATFNVTLAAGVASGQLITATATDPNGNTSEFSKCIMVVVSGCAATTAAERTADPIGTLDLMYRFRDEVLARTDRGRQYTNWFYQFSGEAVTMMASLNGPANLLSQTVAMLDRYKPVIQSMVNRGAATVNQAGIEDVDGLLKSYAASASAQLRSVIEQLRRDLRDPRVQAEFGIKVTTDNGCTSSSIVLQDDKYDVCLILDRCTGSYRFRSSNGETFTGPVVITETQTSLSFQSGPSDPNFLSGGVNLLRRAGLARLIVPRTRNGRVFSIFDSYIDNSRPCR